MKKVRKIFVWPIARVVLVLYLLLSFVVKAQVPTLTAHAISPQQVNLAWTRIPATPDAYTVERKEDNFGQQFAAIASNLSGTTYAYEDKSVNAGKTYVYRLNFYCDKGCGGYTAEVKVTVPLPPPNAPGSLDAFYLPGRGMVLTWVGNNDADVSYIVERAVNGGSNFNEIATVPYNRTLGYTDNTTSLGNQYCYRVKARRGSADSPYSNTKCADTPQNVPSAPTALIATANQVFQIQLNWIDGSTNETGFEIERSTNNVNFSKISTTGANITQFMDGPLIPDTRYYYRIRAINASGASGYTNVAEAVSYLPPPSAPSGLTANPVDAGRIDLTWTDNADNEAGFEIERSGDGTTYNKIAEVGSNVTAYQNTGLSPATRYWYRVRAKNRGGTSGYSNVADATTRDTAPNAPRNLSATPVSNKQINMSWQDNSGNETGFELESSPDGTNFTKLTDLPANATSYTHTGLATLTRYWYRIRAKNAIGYSAYSETASATTFDVPPLAPSALVATTVSASEVGLTWKDNAANESGFEIERSTNGINYTKVGETAANAITYQNTGLSPATRYWYRVRAKNSQGGSDYSNVATATTKDVPPASPSDLAATAISYQQINLSWTDKAGNETGFEIETSTDGSTFAKVSTVAANVRTFQSVGLKQLTRYYFRVRAINAIGNSGYSNIATATTPKAPLPDTPKGLTALPVDFDLIQLSWSQLSENATTVIIERSMQPDRSFVQIGSQAAANTRFADREILDVSDYYYRIKAVNGAGESAYSAVAKVAADAIITGTEPAFPPQNRVYAADNILYLELDRLLHGKVRIYDMQGTLRQEFEAGPHSQASLQGVGAGIYLVVIETDKGTLKQKILIH
jgi:fibronectin type 3 domain-containing protein